jgi:hypothetical protein
LIAAVSNVPDIIGKKYRWAQQHCVFIERTFNDGAFSTLCS